MRQFKSQAEAEAAGVYVSKVKSFVKREGRLTKAQEKALEDHWPTKGIDYAEAPLSLSEIFGRSAPVVVEIGFGMGKSLVEMAANAPEKDFIGIEVHRPGVGACLAEASEQGVENLRVMDHDAVEVLKNMIPDGSLSRLQLFFPDPWHKKRHHKRRLIQHEFVQRLRHKLRVGGILHLATDWENYAEHMMEIMGESEGFANSQDIGEYSPRPDDRPITKFEKRGETLGHGVWDLVFYRTN